MQRNECWALRGGSFMMEEFDEFVRWEAHPLRYLFATITLISALTWLGFAGDNLQGCRMFGSLSFCGGCTFRQLWKNSWSANSGRGLTLIRPVVPLSAQLKQAVFCPRIIEMCYTSADDDVELKRDLAMRPWTEAWCCCCSAPPLSSRARHSPPRKSSSPSSTAAAGQGLTLVHFLAQCKRLGWDRGCIEGLFRVRQGLLGDA